jgi:hypothetical protein
VHRPPHGRRTLRPAPSPLTQRLHERAEQQHGHLPVLSRARRAALLQALEQLWAGRGEGRGGGRRWGGARRCVSAGAPAAAPRPHTGCAQRAQRGAAGRAVRARPRASHVLPPLKLGTAASSPAARATTNQAATLRLPRAEPAASACPAPPRPAAPPPPPPGSPGHCCSGTAMRATAATTSATARRTGCIGSLVARWSSAARTCALACNGRVARARTVGAGLKAGSSKAWAPRSCAPSQITARQPSLPRTAGCSRVDAPQSRPTSGVRRG